MLILCICLVTLSAYFAGACGQGMKNGWKKDLTVLFFLVSSWYFSIALVGYVSRNPL